MLYLHKNRPFHNVHNPALTQHKTVNTMKYLYIIITALCLLGCKSQREKELHDTIETLAGEYRFYYKLNVDSRPCHVIRSSLNKIDSLATDKEIEGMARRHSAPIVRLYMFQLLLKRNVGSCMDIAIHQIRDTSSVEVDDTSGFTSYYSYYHDRINNIRINLLTSSCKGGNLAALDSVLLYSYGIKDILYYKTLFKNIPPKPEYYNIIRRHYVDYGNDYALIALAKYRKKQDRELINDALSGCGQKHVPYGFDSLRDIALYAISEWPDDYYIGALKRFSNSYLFYEYVSFGKTLRLVFKALMAYDDDWSRQLIRKSIDFMKGRGNKLDFQLYMDVLNETYNKIKGTGTSELSSLSLNFYDYTKRKVFTVTFNGGKMFVERNIRKVEIKKNLKTNKVVSTDTVTLDKKDSITLSEHDKNAILALLKRMAAQPQTPKRHGVIDDGFYCDVKFKSGRVTITGNTLTGDTSVASLANLIRKMSPIRIAF